VYSTYGHVYQLAEAELQGLKQVPGIEAQIFQVPETLSPEILAKMHAPAKPDYPVISVEQLPEFDAFIFGFPTTFGSVPAQVKTFWDATGGLWASGALYGKYVAQFVNTGTSGGGQEATLRNSIAQYVHHGLIYVPLGYATAFPQLTNLQEVHGGSPWGAGAFSAADGSRQPSALEKEIAMIQGKSFGETVAKASKPVGRDDAKEGPVIKPVEKPATADAHIPAPSKARHAAPVVTEKKSSGSKCCIVM
jgi:NAD(P)H dehydrogenase (quinone)